MDKTTRRHHTPEQKVRILRRHYLNLARTDEAEGFWAILPPVARTGSKVVRMTA